MSLPETLPQADINPALAGQIPSLKVFPTISDWTAAYVAMFHQEVIVDHYYFPKPWFWARRGRPHKKQLSAKGEAPEKAKENLYLLLQELKLV